MDSKTVLLDILRCEIDATNHQFTHILALKQWQHDAAAARITEIDDVDFVNAMRIIDHLVENGLPITLQRPRFDPGMDLPSILRAEQSSEARLRAALEQTDRLDAAARPLAETARAPRAAYAEWLEQQLAEAGSATAQVEAPIDALRDLVAHLVTLVEQTLIHAYVEWHGEQEAAADAAWLSSGAAMMHLTRLVKLFAKLPAVPCAGDCRPTDIRRRPGETLAADRELARHCALAAKRAAGRCGHAAIANYCDTIAKSYRAFADWDGAGPHPERDSTPPVFHGFAATLDKFGL